MSLKIVALAGGVGGAKLVDGLYRILPPEDLTVVVNTADDFEHWGLRICPDLDTVCYTLAGLANPETGWGLTGETWHALEAVSRLGGANWFRIGDRDLGTHLERTRRLRAGEPLSQITRDFCGAWGVHAAVVPMTDQPVGTIVITQEHSELSFQEYFVQQRCVPVVKGFRFEGIETAQPAPGVLRAIEQADGIVICPSNPWVSIDPILAVLSRVATGAPQTMMDGKRVSVSVSPIIGGQAVKGPAAKMFTELGLEPNPLTVAQHYAATGLRGMVLDAADARWSGPIQDLGIQPLATDTLMKGSEDRTRLAEVVLNFISRLLRP